MLKYLIVENYRAFKEEARLELKPITLILGKNNVGKSSILQLLSILKQTYLQQDENYSSALRINGRYANAGDPRSLFHCGNINNTLNIGVGFELYGFKELASILALEFQRQIANYASAFYEITSFSKNKSALSSADKLIYDKLNFEATKELLRAITSVHLEKSDLRRLERYLGPGIGRRPNRSYGYQAFFTEINETALGTLELLQNVSLLEKVSNGELFMKLIIEEGALILSTIKFTVDDHILSECIFNESNILNFRSSYISPFRNGSSFNADLEDFNNLFLRDRTLFNCINEESIDGSFSLKDILGKLCKHFIDELGLNFKEENFAHVPPLRTKPRRFYFSNEMVDSLSVPYVVLDTLISKYDVLKKVNNWFKQFEIELSPENEKDIYYRILFAKKFDGIDLDITDVGFGISQVLPVVTFGFISKPHSTLIIEQPEVHLHPKMQSMLADLFDEVTRSENLKTISDTKEVKRNKMVIVETHSEYLITRLAFLHSRFRNNKFDQAFISPEDVSVNFVENGNNQDSSVIKKILSPSIGNYILPDDFIDEELDMYISSLE